MSIPKHYLTGISRKERVIQKKAIIRAKKMYTKKKYIPRPKLKTFKHKVSKHIVDFYKKYKLKISKKNLPKISRVTGIPQSALMRVIKKGEGAYYSSGSRPNQTSHSWAYARLASFLLGRGAYKIDKHVLANVDKSKIKIKLPNIPQQNQDSIKDCCSVVGNENGICKTNKRTFNLPRRFSKKKCNPKNIKGFTMRSSCAPFKECKY